MQGTTTCQAEYIYTDNLSFYELCLFTELKSSQNEFLPSQTWYNFVEEILDR